MVASRARVMRLLGVRALIAAYLIMMLRMKQGAHVGLDSFVSECVLSRLNCRIVDHAHDGHAHVDLLRVLDGIGAEGNDSQEKSNRQEKRGC